MFYFTYKKKKYVHTFTSKIKKKLYNNHIIITYKNQYNITYTYLFVLFKKCFKNERDFRKTKCTSLAGMAHYF